MFETLLSNFSFNMVAKNFHIFNNSHITLDYYQSRRLANFLLFPVSYC